MMDFDFDSKVNELHNKAERVEVLSRIYKNLEDKMKWDVMTYHSADDEHDEAWFTEPDPEEYGYDNKMIAYETYNEVLEMLEKLANK